MGGDGEIFFVGAGVVQEAAYDVGGGFPGGAKVANCDAFLPFGEADAVFVDEERQVGVGRDWETERFQNDDLPEGRFEKIVSAEDVRDAHGAVVGWRGELIGHHAVGAKQHEIIDAGVQFLFPGSAKNIGKGNSFLFHAKAPGRCLRLPRALGFGEISASAVVGRRGFAGMRRTCNLA